MSEQPEKPESKQFWFNLKTLKVERGLKSAATYRVGPFATETEASNALALIAERNRALNAQEESER